MQQHHESSQSCRVVNEQMSCFFWFEQSWGVTCTIKYLQHMNVSESGRNWLVVAFVSSNV